MSSQLTHGRRTDLVGLDAGRETLPVAMIGSSQAGIERVRAGQLRSGAAAG